MEARGSFCSDRPESLCTRLLDPPGSLHAKLWAQGTPCGPGRPPPRPLRLPQHRCAALPPPPQGFSDGPENGLSSTRPSSQPGCRVSAPGDRFWRRRTPRSTCEMEVGAMEARGSFCSDRPESLCTRLLDPPGSLHAKLWAQGTPCGPGRPPPRPLRLPQHRCAALPPPPQKNRDTAGTLLSLLLFLRSAFNFLECAFSAASCLIPQLACSKSDQLLVVHIYF